MKSFSTLSAVTMLVLTVGVSIGCGGSGGDTGSSSSSICSPTLYTPNYGTDPGVTLRRYAQLPIRVLFETSTTVQGQNLENLIRQGFNQWNTRFGFPVWTEVTNPAAANLTVRGQIVSPQTTLGITTVRFFENQPTTIVESSMVVYAWSSLPVGGYAGTATHELGHALGIGGHSADPADIMYFTGNATDLLTDADLNTIRTCYCNFAKSASNLITRLQANSPIKEESIVCDLKH